ncbi:MAG: hypothetical protein PHW36_00670 [Bacilli bacterium]|nr:hypothetical protein [Bacilli bacterium]
MPTDKSAMPEYITVKLKSTQAYEAIDALEAVSEILSCNPRYAHLADTMRNLHGSLWTPFFEQVVKIINADFYSIVRTACKEDEGVKE